METDANANSDAWGSKTSSSQANSSSSNDVYSILRLWGIVNFKRGSFVANVLAMSNGAYSRKKESALQKSIFE